MAQQFEFDLDMSKEKREPHIVYARVGDTESISILAHILSDGEPYTPQGQNAYFECVCPNGHSIRQSANVAGTSVTYVLDSGVLQAAGVINIAYFRFENGTTEEPTYVESTEPFTIIILSGIDDNIDPGDYIAAWRSLQEQLNEIVDYAENAFPTIQNAVNSVSSASSEALDSISKNKQAVEDAASDVMAPVNAYLEQAQTQLDGAITEFKSDGQTEIGAFDTNAGNKLTTFDSNASSKLSQYDSDVSSKLSSIDETMSDAKAQVNANIVELDTATQKAIDAMEAALSEDQYGEILNRLSRVWKLDIKDVSILSGSVDLDTVSTGTYVPSPDAGTTIQHVPDGASGAFILFSGQHSTTAKYQLIIYPAASTPMYVRNCKGTNAGDSVTWGAWDSWTSVGTPVAYPISVENGGTGATTPDEARANLGAGTSDFSGDYNDLENKPQIPTVPPLPLSIQNGGTGATSAAVARQNIGAGTSNFSGDYNDLRNKPDIPEPIATPVSISNGGTGATTATQARANLGAGTSNFSGSYDDLTDKPNIPTVPVSIANGGTGATSASSARTNLGALGPSSVYAGSGISVSTSGNTVTITASGALDLNTYVKNALEALTDEPSMLVNLASTTAADVFEESPRPGVTGTLSIAHGGTGYTSNPSIRVNLGSTSSDNLFGSSSVTPGVTGTLAVARGGTGVTSLSALANNLSQYLGSDASIYVGSKVITSGGNWVTLFSSSQYRSLTGHTFNQSSDCVVVMNGDSDADTSAMYAATYRSSSGNVGVQKASTQTPVRVNYIVISTV